MKSVLMFAVASGCGLMIAGFFAALRMLRHKGQPLFYRLCWLTGAIANAAAAPLFVASNVLALRGRPSARTAFFLTGVAVFIGLLAMTVGMVLAAWHMRSAPAPTSVERLMGQKHRRLGTAYLVLLFGLVIVLAKIGDNIVSAGKLLGPGYFLTALAAPFVYIVAIRVWAQRTEKSLDRTAAVLRSRYLLIAPTFVALILAAALYVPGWLHIRGLLAAGQIWPTDVGPTLSLAAALSLLGVVAALLFWHIGCAQLSTKLALTPRNEEN